MKTKNIIFIAAIALLLVLVGLSTATYISGTWTNSTYAKFTNSVQTAQLSVTGQGNITNINATAASIHSLNTSKLMVRILVYNFRPKYVNYKPQHQVRLGLLRHKSCC